MKKLLLITFVMSLFASTVMAQDKITVSGKVVDTSGEAIIGASVQVKGQSNVGVVTDIDGQYELNGIPSNSTLVFNYIGMVEKEEAVAGRKVVNVTMSADNLMLDELVFVGYGAVKKRDLTGSIVSMNGSEVSSKPASNPLASIQGKVAGVQIVNTGRAGQDPEIRIRGTNSINGYKPLYIVDDLFTDNISHLNPSDIESIEILKDPSSLAIFGIQGANGVIIISTKMAKKGKVTVNINSTVGWKAIQDRVQLTNGDQFRELYNEQLMNQGHEPYDYTVWNANTDWQNEIFQTGFLNQDNISVSGATDKSKFYMSLGYVTEEGSIKSEKMNRITLNLNSEYSVRNWLRFGFKLNGARSIYPDAKGVGSALKAAPIAPTHEVESGLIHTLPDFQRAQVWNPLIETELRPNTNRGENYRITGNIYGEVDILKNLKFRASYSMIYGSSSNKGYSPVIYVYNPDVDGGKERLTDRESVSQSKSNYMNFQQDYVLTYIGEWGNHNLTLTGGITTTYTESSSISGSRHQLDGMGIPVGYDPDRWYLSIIEDGTTASNGSSQSDRFTMSFLARALYNYKGRYLLNASFRRDGSSVFYRTGNTWDNFYSVGAAWVMSEEKFMQNQSVINYLKFKGSWGVLGSQNTGSSYPAFATIGSSGSAVFGDMIIPGKGPTKLISPTLGWERNYAWEAGFDLQMFNSRLSISPVYYSKVTKDMLCTVPGIAGTVPGLQNVGEISNSGVEITAEWHDTIGTDWHYSIGGNFTTIKNKVNSLISKDYSIISGPSRVTEGYPIGYFYGYVVDGVYQNDDDIRFSLPNKLGRVSPGDLKFKDTDGDGVISDKDRTMIGNPTPDFTYGLNLSVGWRGINLAIDMMGVYGNEIYRDWGVSSYAQLNYRAENMNRWNGEGTSNWEPILDPSRAINRENSTYFIEDGSFFRIRNIELSYDFDQKLMKKIKLQALRIFANIQNPKTWSRNSGYTPEIGGSAISFGIDGGGYPMPAVYTMGINLTF